MLQPRPQTASSAFTTIPITTITTIIILATIVIITITLIVIITVKQNSSQNTSLVNMHQVHATQVSSPPDGLVQSTTNVVIQLQLVNIRQYSVA